jgi:WD40 repeat protein
MAINRQSSLMATDQGDGTVAIVDLRTLRSVRTLPARDGSTAAAISFMPGGRTLLTGGINRRVSFWDASSGLVTRTLRFAQPVWWTAASPDGKLLAVQTGPADDASNSHVEVVRIATGEVLQSHALAYAPGGVEFTHDGRELVALACCDTGSGSTLVAWDARTGRQLLDLGDLNATAFDIAPGSELLGVGTESGQVLLLDLRTGRQTAPPIRVATDEITQVSFSPDGRSYAVGSFDGTASAWDVRSGTRVGNQFGPYPETAPSVLFEPNGRLLINLLSNAIESSADRPSVFTDRRSASHLPRGLPPVIHDQRATPPQANTLHATSTETHQEALTPPTRLR